MLKRFLSAYFLLVAVAILTCICIVAADCVNLRESGEFRILSVLNHARFKVDYERMSDEEILGVINAYISETPSDYKVSFAHHFTSIALSAAVACIPLAIALRLLGVKLSRFQLSMGGLSVLGALALIVSLRVYLYGRLGAGGILRLYPAADLSLSSTPVRFTLLALPILAALRGIYLLLSHQEEKNSSGEEFEPEHDDEFGVAENETE